MNAENVTPIRGASPTEPSKQPKPPRTPKKCSRFHLDQPDGESDNMRLIQALHGVCNAIEQLAEHGPDAALELGTAAEILSEMLMARIDTGIEAE